MAEDADTETTVGFLSRLAQAFAAVMRVRAGAVAASSFGNRLLATCFDLARPRHPSPGCSIGVPPGFALVPLEPTPAMIRASLLAVYAHIGSTPPGQRKWGISRSGGRVRGYVIPVPEKAAIRYRAMVKAAIKEAEMAARQTSGASGTCVNVAATRSRTNEKTEPSQRGRMTWPAHIVPYFRRAA